MPDFPAFCPLHDPSRKVPLRVSFEPPNTILSCRSGCPDHLIAEALGLSLVSLMDFDDSDFFEKPPREENHKKVPPSNEITATAAATVSSPSPPPRWSYFDVRPVLEWLDEAKVRPAPRPLFGDFWLEGELSILFADTGKGKSLLAVQIGESIARGVPIEPFDLDFPEQKVLYFDFELSSKQFESRYSSGSERKGCSVGHYRFSPNFLRAEVAPGDGYPGAFDSPEDFFYSSFDEEVRDSGAKVLIVDNITFLNNSSNEGGRSAIRLMHGLKRLKNKYGLSILALAHTPKRRYSMALTVNDLQGSKMISNFADNIFALGDSISGKDIRYLKHIKPRSTQLRYGASNVCTYRIRKENNFLGFHFIRFSAEREHLFAAFAEGPRDRKADIKKAKVLSSSGLSIREIATRLYLAPATIHRYLKDPPTDK